MFSSETPKISVVIYSYNFERFLKESIESILAQTLLPYEILICDDHSTDKSWDIICKYSENYPELIKSYRHKKNIGMTANGNFGFKKINGELISWVDGDDRWLPTKLELEWKALRKYPDAKIAYSNVYIIDINGNRKCIWDDGKFPAPPTGDAFVQVFSRRFFPNSTSVYRNDLMYRSVFDEIGYLDEELEIYVDWDFKIRATEKFPIIYSGLPLVEYRVHKKGISNSPREVLYRDMIRVYEKNIHRTNYRSWNEKETIKNGVEQNLRNILPSETTKLMVPESEKNMGKVEDLHKPYQPVEIIEEHEKSKCKLTPTNFFGENLIFLISQPRAGSTLLQRILHGHPYIQTTAEPWIMLHPIYALKKNGLLSEFDSNIARLGLEDFISQVPERQELYYKALRHMGSTLYNRVLEVSGKRLFLDKTPRYHFIIPELKTVFPKAKFIFLLRNPLAVLSSTLKSWFNNQPERLQKSPNYLDLIQGPLHLIQGIQLLKEDAVVVKYEELVNETENTLKAICFRLGIAYHCEMLNYGLQPKPEGRLGDSLGIIKHDNAVPNYINKWASNFKSLHLYEFAKKYMETLGPEVFDLMGYPYQENKSKLEKSQNHAISKVKLRETTVCLQTCKSFEDPHIDDPITILKTKLKQNPLSAQYHNDLGILYFNSGEKDKALQCYRKAAEIQPEHITFQKNLADFYYGRMGQVESALNIYIKILENNPKDIETLTALAKIYIDLEKFEDALDFYDRILALDPSNQTALKGLENSKNRIDQLPSSSHRCSQDCQSCSCDKYYLVSAIVSCYNSEDFIRGRLEDLEAQTIAQLLEIIVIDSGSKQNERAIVDELEQAYSNIKYIRTKNRETIYAAWNRGIKAASGKYIVNANTDDRLRNDALEIMIRTLEEKPAAAVVYIDQILTNTPNQTFENYHTDGFLKRSEATREIMVQKNPCGPQVMWRRALHDQIGYFRSDYEVAGDWEFWLRVVFEARLTILHIPELLGLYYYNIDGLEHGGRKQKERLKEINEIKEKYGKMYQVSINEMLPPNDFLSVTSENCGIKKNTTETQEKAFPKKTMGRNVLLTTSAAPSQTPFSTTEKRAPIGIGFLISVLRSAGHNVFFLDNFLQPYDFLETDYLQANDIDFVGIYADTICYRDTLRMLYKLEWFRRTGRWKGKIIVGGPHTTVCLDTIPDFVDYIVQGEGETAIVDIVEGKADEGVVNYPRIKNLDELPMPAWDYFVDLPYDWSGNFFPQSPVFSMNTSRGCPFSCKFCSVNSIWGKRYTYFSAERVVADIEYLIKKYGAKGIYFREDNFTLNRKRLIKFCDLLKEKNIKISWACESRVNTLDEEIVKLMSETGACGFYFGVESGSQKILNFLKKDITLEQTREAFRLCHKYGIKTAASVVVGVPTETEKDINETLSLLSEVKPTVTWFNVFVGIPNSDLYQHTLDNKLYEFIDDRGLVYLKGHNERVNAFYGGQWDARIPVDISQEPTVSVIMSVYNGENYLKEAVLSILNQTYQDFEFIIVDDASTDKTLGILKGFDDPRIKIISNSENCGLTESLNKAIRSAKGNYIARMDADDVSLPHRFERQLEFLEKNTGYALVGSSYYKIDENGNKGGLIQVLTADGKIKKGLKKQNWFGHGSVMMKRDVLLEKGGYNVKFKYAQDYDLWLRIADDHKLANIDEPLYCWRSTKSSISREKEEEQRNYAEMAISEANKRGSKNGDAERKVPLISVIVPTFNRPQMLEASIKSILSQTYQNFEIIVVNDAGVDVSELIQKFQDLRIQYIQHVKNKGLAAARNTGIKNASGLYIALLDDDDIFYAEHLDLAQKCLNDSIPVIYTDSVRATFTKCGDTYKLIRKHVPYSIEFDRHKLLIGNISPVNCFVFNKKLAYKAGLFDETLSTLEDWDFWIRLSALAPFKHLAQPTVQVNWRNDGTTMTSLLGSEFKKNRERIYKRYQDEINRVPNLHAIMEEFQQIWANDWQGQVSLTSIVILTCNQLDYTKKCIESIFEHTVCPHELIVVDNGSTDGTVEFLESEFLGKPTAARIKIIKNNVNKGFAGGNNQGMAAASGEYILLLNNDVVVTPGWLERMIFCAEKEPEIGIVGPRSNCVSGPQLVEGADYDTHTLNGLIEFSNKFADDHAGQAQQILRVVGFCMLIKRAVIDKIGGMDDRYGLGNFEDDDFSLRATIAGFQSWIARDCFIHHFGHRTFIGEKVDLSKSLHKNWGVFKDKWGLQAEKPYGSPYRLSEMKNTRFDPSIHYYPLDNESAGMKKSGNDSKTAEVLYSTIHANLNTKPSKEVIEDLQNLIASYPEFALAYNDLGVLYYSGGNKEKALKYYERAVQLDPANSNFNKNLADFYYAEMGRVEDALRIYVKILEANPEDVETLLITGHICVALEKFQDAEVFYSRVLEIEPGHQDALQFLDKLNSMKTDNSGAKTPEELYREVQPLLNNGDPHRAIGALERLLEKFPDFALAHNDLGVIYYHTGNKEKAQHHYESAVEMMPENINFQKNLADFYCLELGRIEEALKIYVDILITHPQDVETLLATGQICVALEKPGDARDFFNRVLEIEPWNETVRQYLEELERPPSATTFLNAESPDEIYQRLKQKLSTLSQAEAIDELEKLLGSYPDFALGHNDLGVLYYHTGDKEKTLHHYRQAVQLQPENLTFQKNLTDLLFVELGKIEEALQIYVNILALNPHDVETLLITGHICVTLKKFDDARDFYHRVLELEPGNEDAGNNLRALNKHPAANGLSPAESANSFSVLTDKVESDDLEADRSAAGQQAATVSIIISLDGIQNRVKECIKSVMEHTSDPHEILLINRGATKGLLKWAQQLAKDNDHYHIIGCARQAGRAEYLNQTIQKAGGEMVVLLHNDVVVPEGWLKAFKMCINLVPNIGAVGPMSNRTGGIQQIIHSDESDRVEFESAAKAFYEQNQYRRVVTRKLSDFCLAFPRELPDKIGYFDEQFVSEEVVVEDFCKRAASGGYQNLIAADTYVYHYDRHKNKKNASTINSASTADRKKYKEKWNGTQNPEVKALQTVQLLARTEELSQKGKIDAAVEVLLGGIGVQPEDPRFYLALSEILLTAKKFQDAKEALTEMPSADEKQEMRKAQLLAYAEEGLENYEAAQAQIEQVLLMNSGHAPALNLKGILAYRNDDCPSAEKYFKRAIDADPGYGEPYTNLGMLQLEADQQEEALKSFEKGFRLTPTDFDIATNYHTLIAGIAEYQKAENVARDVAFLYPNNQKIKYMLIDFLVQQGKYEMAMPEIEDAIITFGTDNGILSAALKVREKLGPITIQKSLEKVPVSLCMIIKDEEKYLARCLASVKPIVDEMIVVDTGSTDRSKDIAITFGAKVYDYEWKNDFAEARNYSISKASGEWILILDGDEVISPLDHAHFSKMVKKTPRVPIAYSIITRNYNKLANIVGWIPNDGTYLEEEAAIGWLPSEKVRLFYGKDQIWFEGAVHELVDPVLKKNGIEIKKCRLPVHHYGRLDNEKLERKGEIYFDIGKKKLSAMGDDLNALRELAVQATILEKNQEAFELWQRLLSLNPIPNLAAIAYVNMGTIYSRLGKFEDALDAGKKAVKHDPDLKEARYNHAMAELHCGNAPKTIRVLEDLLKGFPDYPPARFILSAAYCCAHQKEKGLEGIRKLRDTPMGTHLDIPCLELAQSLISAGKMEYALWVLGAAIESDIVNPQLLALFKECLNMKDATQNCSHIPQPPQANFQGAIFENLPQ